MFVVKWIAVNQSQALYYANEVHFTPVGEDSKGVASVYFEDAERNVSIRLDTGMVYVMNSYGSTVASYELGPTPNNA